MTELARENCITRYSVGGDHFLEICNWLKHQKIDKPSPSKIPPFVEGSATIREDSPNAREDSRSLPVGLEGNGMEGKGMEAVAKPRTRLSPTVPTDEHRSQAKELGLDCETEFAKFTDYGKAKGRKLKDESAGFRNWLRKAAEFGKGRPESGAGAIAGTDGVPGI